MSLRRKLFIPQLAVAAAIAVYIYGVWSPAHMAAAGRDRLRLIQHHLETVEAGLIPLLLHRQLDVVHEHLNALLNKNPQWTSVRLTDAQGRQLYPLLGVAPPPRGPGQERHTFERTIEFLGSALGKLAVDVDMAPSQARNREETARLAQLILGLFAVLLAVTALTLEMTVLRPVRQLANAAIAISGHDFTAPLPAAGKDEVGELGNSFAAMRASLNSHQSELLREIAERERAQDEALRLNAELEARVLQRTSALEEANRGLAAANKELEAFNYSISHDLRTPLRAIEGYSRIVLDEHHDKLDAEGQRCLRTVIKNVGRLSQLIDDLLAFSRASRLEIGLKDVDMAELAREVFEELREAAPSVEVRFSVEGLPGVCGDRAMLRQVMRNLIGNAIKFTDCRKEHAVVEVTGTVDERECVYCVRDNGAGFDMAFSRMLFGVFQRLHSNDEFAGTGIGLAIVKRIVERHGGRVWAEGKVGEGAAFYFALPKSDATPNSAVSPMQGNSLLARRSA